MIEKKILITGINGYLGKKVYEKLKKKFIIYGIGRDKKLSKKKNIINKTITHKNLNELKCIPDIILHIAGGSSVSKSFEDPKKDEKDTFKSGKILIDYYSNLKLKKKIKYILISSAAVYGEKVNKTKPISPYGKNKLKLEKYFIKKLKTRCHNLLILRLFSLYGEGLKKQLLWDACDKILNNNFEFYGTGKEIRSWVYIEDFLKILIKFMTIKLKNKIEIIDIAGDSVVKNKDIITLICKNFKVNKKNIVFNNKKKIGDPQKLISNTKKKYDIIKYSTPIKKGILNYVKWFKKEI